MTASLLPRGSIRLEGVSRRFKVLHEQNKTLKETLVRRKRASYTEMWALRDVSMVIQPGEAIGIVGRNGSGKSTLLKLLAGILPAHAGIVQANGTIAAMLELGSGFHPDFTGRENVFMNAAIHGLTDSQVRARFADIVAFAEIDDFIDMPVRTYSSGMQLRLAFAVAAHVDPDILLLDEVLAVGDEAFQRKCLGRIFEFQRNNGTLVFVSHDPNAVEQICDRAILVDGGRIIHDGQPHEVMNEYHRLLAKTGEGLGAKLEKPAQDELEALDDTLDASPAPPSELGGWGSGELVISAVQVLHKGEVANGVVSGTEISIQIRLERHEAVSDAVIGIGIQGEDGTTLFGTNTGLDNTNVTLTTDTTVVKFDIASLPLHAGRFHVTVAAHSEDLRKMYHWIDDVTSFTVFPRIPGTGVVEISGIWNVEPGSRVEGRL